MKVLIIGGNRFVGLRVAMALDRNDKVELSVLNRTGQSPHLKNAAVYKGDRRNFPLTGLDSDWDIVIDFANYDDVDTQSSLNFFKKVGRYIFVSTASVYDEGANRKEDAFKPLDWKWSSDAPMLDTGLRYQEGKRRAEALFARQNQFPVLSIRFPFILGPDDYTRRLEFHVERIEKNQTLYVPNMASRISMINSEDAADFINWSLDKEFSGPLNVASADPISMARLLQEIEARTGHRLLLVQSASPQNRSPYGPAHDAFLNCEKLLSLGFTPKPIQSWLPDLIDGARETPPPKVLH